MRRVASLWLPRLATDLLCQRHPGWRARPLATTTERARRLFVCALNRQAEAQGIVPGQPLADARILAPDLCTVPADLRGDSRKLAGIAQWCTRFTPWAAPDGHDGVLLDITGCAHLFGGEAGLLADLVARLGRHGFEARAAIADTPGAAWAVARFGTASSVGERIVPPGGQRDALAALSVASLRLPGDIVTTLQRLGLNTVGALYPLPRTVLARRFGPLLYSRLDQALGRAAEPISPREPTAPWRVRLGFAEPITRPEDIRAGLDHLLQELCLRLAAEEMGARRLGFTLFRVDATTAHAEIGTSRPARDPMHLRRLFSERLDKLDPGFGVDLMMLTALSHERLTPKQGILATLPDGGIPQELDILADRLANRLGPRSVFRIEPVESYLPERALRRTLALSPGRQCAWPQGQPRPIRLFADPELIEATAPVPDDPPLQFTWRRRIHRIRRAEGPERIAMEWWRMDAAAQQDARDYYRVEDEAGERFWLYRDGLHEAGRPARWYLHGLFA